MLCRRAPDGRVTADKNSADFSVEEQTFYVSLCCRFVSTPGPPHGAALRGEREAQLSTEVGLVPGLAVTQCNIVLPLGFSRQCTMIGWSL